jgi:hypothetical protein
VSRCRLVKYEVVKAVSPEIGVFYTVKAVDGVDFSHKGKRLLTTIRAFKEKCKQFYLHSLYTEVLFEEQKYAD